jgi:hypothetical protein
MNLRRFLKENSPARPPSQGCKGIKYRFIIPGVSKKNLIIEIHGVQKTPFLFFKGVTACVES